MDWDALVYYLPAVVVCLLCQLSSFLSSASSTNSRLAQIFRDSLEIAGVTPAV